MYDNVDFKLRNTDVSEIDFLDETPQYLDIVTGEHDFNGKRVVSGILGNTLTDNYFKVTVSGQGVNIKNGSLCKFYLGNNFKTLQRADVQKAIEKLSDTLHLPIREATVTRLDIAQNFILKEPPDVYYSHFGELQHSKRSPITTVAGGIEGLYYFNRFGLSLFYNKLKEQKDKGQPIPELYQNSHVMRYEQRYTKRLSKSFNVERLTAATLYNEKFYIDVINRWRDNYFSIKKINDISLNFEAMKGRKDLYTFGVLFLIESQGGELSMIAQINEAYKTGKLTRRQADEMKLVVRDTCKVKEGITVKNDAILELDRKVAQAVKYYR